MLHAELMDMEGFCIKICMKLTFENEAEPTMAKENHTMGVRNVESQPLSWKRGGALSILFKTYKLRLFLEKRAKSKVIQPSY